MATSKNKSGAAKAKKPAPKKAAPAKTQGGEEARACQEPAKKAPAAGTPRRKPATKARRNSRPKRAPTKAAPNKTAAKPAATKAAPATSKPAHASSKSASATAPVEKGQAWQQRQQNRKTKTPSRAKTAATRCRAPSSVESAGELPPDAERGIHGPASSSRISARSCRNGARTSSRNPSRPSTTCATKCATSATKPNAPRARPRIRSNCARAIAIAS